MKRDLRRSAWAGVVGAILVFSSPALARGRTPLITLGTVNVGALLTYEDASRYTYSPWLAWSPRLRLVGDRLSLRLRGRLSGYRRATGDSGISLSAGGSLLVGIAGGVGASAGVLIHQWFGDGSGSHLAPHFGIFYQRGKRGRSFLSFGGLELEYGRLTGFTPAPLHEIALGVTFLLGR